MDGEKVGSVSSSPQQSHSRNGGSMPTAQTPYDRDAHDAAELIQRNYRGYRERRQLSGLGVDAASKRWARVAKEAQWQNSLRPRTPARTTPNSDSSTDQRRKDSQDPRKPSFAQQEWKRLAAIARQAGNDDPSDSDSDLDPHDPAREERRRARSQARKDREDNAKMMGLQYFLELVDEKHRYGSHLRAYHAEWMKSDTNENFFYWLDHGDGREVEVPTCSREVLDRDQVRYLSREERRKYLVKIDDQGRLRWVKNGERVNTSYQYRDSLEGIVPADSNVPVWREGANGTRPQQSNPAASSSPSLSSMEGEDSGAEGQHYVNQDLESAKGIKKIQHVSAGALLNHLLQSTTKKNTWIFAADKSFRIYIGIKQSGAFQHSSFLYGGRLAAAGLIKVKDGQLRSLSPLSGHYRPPTRNFRAFVHSLDDSGVDMSRVSISKSYAVLLGLESYVKTKRKAQAGVEKIKTETEKVVDPAAARKREEKQMDKSQSARREKEHLARLAEEDEKRKRESSLLQRVRRKLSLRRGAREDAPTPS